jgi:hypothetical protein
MLAWISACKCAGSNLPTCTGGFLTGALAESFKNRPNALTEEKPPKLIAGRPLITYKPPTLAALHTQIKIVLSVFLIKWLWKTPNL